MKNQKGTFSIELALVLIGMTALLFFIFDLGYQVIQKSQLHRTSYSLVSVLKERKAFYSPNSRITNWGINQSQADQVLKMAKRLQGEKATLRISIGLKSGTKDEVKYYAGDASIKCDSRPLIPKITEGDKHGLNVYRVTICKKVPAFFEKAVTSDENKTDRILSSTSLFVGR
ncbi:tight adherence pilus pseudopilin TadF [Photobacterium kagoshimensis]|uniref:tight adherence pilus pseudopilin TadF n=1 Tax=Photobacterium kagoshimensis TaxID=2910242 RepID=UPI003D0F466A